MFISHIGYCQIHNFKNLGVMNETFKNCCKEPSHQSFYEIFRNESLKSDDNRVINQMILNELEKTLNKLDKLLASSLE